MNVSPTHTPDDLRNACLAYLVGNAEPDPRDIMTAETPGGLHIENGPGWLTISGVWVEPVPGAPAGVEVDDSLTWNYGDSNSPHAVRTAWAEEGPNKIKTLPRRDHNKIASGLMRLLEAPELAAAS